MAPQQKKTEKKQNELPPADVKIDENKTYNGECVYFNKRGGFGFIKPDTTLAVEKVMVMWREIQTDDRWPYLHKGLKVQFQLTKFVPKSGKGAIVKAVKVFGADGKKVALQDELEAKKEYVHSQSTRFTGTVKFYNVAKGAGFVTLDGGYAGVDDIKDGELRVVRSEINSGNNAPSLRKEMKVEFGIMKNMKGQYSCYSVTLPGGDDIARTFVEERKAAGTTSYDGEVTFYCNKGRYGYIKPANTAKFPAAAKKAMEAASEAAQKKLQKQGKDKKADKLESLLYFRRGDLAANSGKVWRGNKATFKLYTDNRGAGACEVKIAA